jgi:hypothetical protein
MKLIKENFELNLGNGGLVAGTICFAIAVGSLTYLGNKLVGRQDFPEVVEKATNVIYMNKYKPIGSF